VVTHNQQHSAKRPASQDSPTIAPSPNEIGASTPYDFRAAWARLHRVLTWPAAALRRAMFLLLVVVVGVQAQTTIQAPPRVGVGLVQRKLALRESIEMALRHNLEIEIEKSNTATAGEALRAARGFYDPTLRWLPAIESRNTPTGSVLLGSDGKLTDHFHSHNFYFRQKLPFAGAGFNVDFENGRQSTTNPFTSLSPFLTSRLVLSFSQPLVRNRLIDRERAEIQIRRKQLDVSEAEFEARVIDVITRVEQAYWDLVAARQDAEVKRDNVDWAQRQLEQNRRMIAAGTLAAVELAASEAELERRRDTWYSSLGVVTEVENALKAMVTGGRGDELWKDEVIPVEDKPLDAPPTEDLAAAVTSALRRRPELRQISLRQETNDVQKRLNTDQTKPQVNLVASYGNTGLGGTLAARDNPFSAAQADSFQRLNDLSARAGLPPLAIPSFGGAPDLLIGGYGTAVSNLFAGRFQTFQVGIAFDLTLRNRAAEASLAQSVIAERRLKLEQARVEQAIEVQVRNALQGIQTARQRTAAAEASARAAREKLDSETRLFEAGDSTNFFVLTRQNEYADSRRRAVAARLDLNKAVARLEQALGTTLTVHQVTLR